MFHLPTNHTAAAAGDMKGRPFNMGGGACFFCKKLICAQSWPPKKSLLCKVWGRNSLLIYV